MQKKAAKTVERRIYFYKYRQLAKGKPLPTPQDIVNVLKSRPIESMNLTDGRKFFGEDVSNTNEIRLRFTESSRFGLGKLEENLKLLPLPLTTNQNVAESIHLQFFGDSVVGAEYNFRGPRVSQLEYYLSERYPELGRLKFSPCINRELQEKIQKSRGVNLLKLRVTSSNVGVLERLDEDLGLLARNTMEQTFAREVTLKLMNRSLKDDKFTKWAMNVVGKLMGDPDAQAHFATTRVHTKKDKQTDKFMIFEDKLQFIAQIILVNPNERSVDTEDVFLKINEGYLELQNDLKKAHVIDVDED